MGNHQSKPHQNRLSKPKTNTNSPNLVPKAESPASMNSRYADLSAKGRQQIKDTLLSPIAVEHVEAALPTHEDATEDLSTQASDGPANATSRNNSRTHSRSNSISCFGSRHGSMTKMSGFAESKLSLSSNTAVDMEAAIRLLQEVKRNASPEELAALHEVLESVEEHGEPSSEQNLSRNTSLVNRSSSSLTRRRSLVQTPGVATRNSSVEGRRRTWNSWRTPKLSPEEEAQWNAAYRGPSPMARLSVVHSLNEDRGPPTARAQTPSDLDYGHLGGLRLGTLMVTNGAPSPAAATVLPDRTPNATTGDNYFSVPEANSDDLMMKSTKRRGYGNRQSAPIPTSFHREASSPAQQNERMVEYKPEFESSYSSSNTANLQVDTRTHVSTPHSADQYAQSYLVDLPDSPFAPSKQDFGGLEFELEDTQCALDENAHTVHEPVYELDAGVESTRLELSDVVPHMPIPTKHEGRANHRPQPRTYDSGYSSGGSFRTADLEGQDTAPSAPSTQRSNLQSGRTNSPGKPMPKSILVRSSTLSTDLEPPKGPRAFQRPEPLMLSDTSARLSGSDATLSPQTPRSVASRASFDSTSSKNTKKLQRRRPSQAEVPIVQTCQPIPEGTIPEVPDHVRAKFTRRLSNTPGIECLTNTYQTKDDVTIPVDMDSTQYVEHTSAATEHQSIRSDIHQLTELEPVRPPTPPAHGRRRSRSLFRRKSTAIEREPEDPALSIVDLGTIAASLGTSPYDIAMTGPRQESVTPPTHPHQLGTGLPRRKSLVRMDSDAAAEFARMRSKDRMVVDPKISQLPQRPQQQPRRKSYHGSIDAGEAKASKRRPQSFVGDIPPVPFIDRSKHSGQLFTAISARDIESQKMLQSKMSLRTEANERRQAVTQSLGGDVYQNQSLPQHTVDWEAHATTWSQRRKTVGEGLRTQRGVADVNSSNLDTRMSSQTTHGDVESWGRFSGGLGYGYEGRGVGVGGSAGTRQLNSYASPKSMQWRVQHGVDLSDVPIMVQKV
ncbi:hypothetical protein NX059_007407 [Plenodomus lindquistii]|nr:hypothetical protein NX059_007407 [Plenodomus lindquistii]